MKLDRNINADGRGKYGLIKNRRLEEIMAGRDVDAMDVRDAIEVLERAGIIDWGSTPGTEFFAIRIKDKYAGGALTTYAQYAIRDGEVEYGQEIMQMAKRAAEFSPHCKKPD